MQRVAGIRHCTRRARCRRCPGDTERYPAATVTAGWALPASWSDIPPLTGLTVLSTSVAIGVDGVLHRPGVHRCGPQQVEVCGRVAGHGPSSVSAYSDPRRDQGTAGTDPVG